MRGWPITYQDFSGGRNTQDAPYLLNDSQARDCLNVHTSLTGDLEKRNGFVTLSGATLTGSPVNGTLVHSLFPANTTTKSLLGVCRTASTDTIFKLTTGGTASALKTGLTANKRWYWTQAGVNGGEGPIFGMNGVDTPQRWNGATASTSNWVATTGTVPAKGKFLTYFSERLWCGEGSRLWFSGITGSSPDPMNWEANDYVDLEPNDGQEITGIGVVGTYLVVFKPRKTYIIYDLITGANRQISKEIGCAAHRSIVQTPAGLLFLSEDQGVCMTDGASVKPISDQIQPDLTQVASHPETQELAAATLEGRRYFLSVSLEGTRNDHTLEYDLIKGSWWLHSCASNQFALVDPGGTPALYSADSLAAARVSKAFVSGVFTDNGAKYAGSSFWTTAQYAWGSSGSMRYLRYVDPHRVKRLRESRIDGVGNWVAYIASDFTDEFDEMQGEVWEATADTSGVWGGEELWGGTETTWGTNAASVIERRYRSPGLGRSLTFKYQNDDDQNFKIYSTTHAIQMRED